ncbi:c-type cytochrome [Paraburkholderia pallida]|uniref:Cytochrome c4 n=1 Tax=Paraburkholderia pallida TaxID=2547399 RepID=A0A4P7D5N9_9BURK|nr:c-type cytochrome [Paraburkholderia pallida]QBR01924.1 cytochrome c4 [Paraburkholderia pallida]
MRRSASARYAIALAWGTAAVLASLAAMVTNARADEMQARVHDLVVNRCAACHGVDGNSVAEIYPRLAGQYPPYLYKQLTQFKGGPDLKPLRHSAVMQAMVTDLSDADMEALAQYYAAQTPTQGATSHTDLAEAGKEIYTHGGAGGAPACISCHRATGGGIAPDFPRITGQHEAYVNEQLHAWKDGQRGGKGKLMSLIVPLLSDDEIAQVSAYVASLKQ